MSDPTDDRDAYFVRIDSRAPAGETAGASSRGRPGRGSVAALACLAVVALVAVLGLVRWVSPPPLGAPSEHPSATAASASAARADGAYAFWATNQGGAPVRWNACEPIHWVLNTDGAPPRAQSDVAAAATRVTRATGIDFVFDGATDESPAQDRSPYQPDRYGERWAPVLIAWQAGAATDLPLGDGDRAVAVPVAVDEGSGSVFVSAQVVLNRDRGLAPGFATRSSSWGATLMHELGHVVGLDHVDDPRQLMYPYPGRGPVAFADGDLAGLEELGASQGCSPSPSPGPVEVEYVQDFGR